MKFISMVNFLKSFWEQLLFPIVCLLGSCHTLQWQLKLAGFQDSVQLSVSLRSRLFIIQCVCFFPRLAVQEYYEWRRKPLFLFYLIFPQESIYYLCGVHTQTRHLVLMLSSFQKCQVMIRLLFFILHWGITSNWKTSKNLKIHVLSVSVAGFFCFSVLGIKK